MRTSQRTNYVAPAVLLISVLTILIFTAVGNAKDTDSATGTVRGTVADGQSSTIPSASIKLKRGTQVTETSANEAGEYELAKLLPGEYTLEATSGGFKPRSKTITIHAGETLVENITLEIGDLTTSVTVATATQE